MGGQPLLAFWCADERRGITVQHAFAAQILRKGPDGGQLARGGRARVAALVQIAQERPDVVMGEVVGREVGTLLSEMFRYERDELGEVTFLGANRARRGGLIQHQVFEKLPRVS